MALTITDILKTVLPPIGLVANPDGTFRIGVEDLNSDEILAAIVAGNVDLAVLEIINTAIQVAVEASQVDLAALEVINTAIQAATEAVETVSGTQADAIVAAGAVGTISAKLRRVTQGLADLLTGLGSVVLAAGTAIIGRVLPPATVETPFTGSGNVVVGTENIAPGAVYKLTEIELTLSAAPTTGTQNLVITKDDGVGGAYDNVLLTIDLVANAVTSLVIKPGKALKAADVITAAWTNTDGRTYGLIFKYQLL